MLALRIWTFKFKSLSQRSLYQFSFPPVVVMNVFLPVSSRTELYAIKHRILYVKPMCQFEGKDILTCISLFMKLGILFRCLMLAIWFLLFYNLLYSLSFILTIGVCCIPNDSQSDCCANVSCICCF